MTPAKTTHLSEVAPGTVAVVVDVTDEGPFGRRLLDIGFVKGACVRVIKSAPLGDPIEYCLGGTHVSLRKQEAEQVIVAPLPEAVCMPRGRRHFHWRRGRGLNHERGGSRERGERRGPGARGPRWLRREPSE